MLEPRQDHMEPDISINEGRYVRLPLKMIYGILIIWSALAWGYFDLRADVRDTRKVTDATAVAVAADHHTLMDMHDDVLKISDSVDESKRMYNRYFRDFNDPDRYSAPRGNKP